MKAESYSASIIRAMDRMGSIEIRSKGTSMFPFIIEGDNCFFRSCKPGDISKGDVLLFINDTGALVCHRVLSVQPGSSESPAMVICKGDTNRFPDEPVPFEQIIGKLTQIHRRRFVISPDKGLGRLWGKLVIGRPPFAFILHKIARMYRWRSNHISNRS